MTADSVAVVCASAVPVLGALGWALRRLEKAVRLLFGDEDHPGLHAWQATISDRLKNIDDGNLEILRRLDNVEHELHPNNGESMRDALDRVELMRDALTRVEQMVSAQPPRIPNQREGDQP